MKILVRTAVALFLAVLLFSPTPSHAEENSPSESAQELITPVPTLPFRKPWEASLDGVWWPESNSSDAGGRVGLSEARFKFGRTFRLTPRVSVTPDFAYSFLHIAAPDTARLPEALHSFSVGLRGDYQANSKLTLSLLLGTGLAGDFKRIGGDDIRCRFGVSGRYNISDKLTLLAGLIYQQGYRNIPVFPVMGVIFRPNEQWVLSLAAPRPGVMYIQGKDLRLYLGGDFSGGEYQLHDNALGAEVIKYRDVRVVCGADFTVAGPLKGELAAGYAFARKFQFYDRFDDTRQDINVNAGPFGRAGLKMEW